jgi:hypothetical protein
MKNSREAKHKLKNYIVIIAKINQNNIQVKKYLII